MMFWLAIRRCQCTADDSADIGSLDGPLAAYVFLHIIGILAGYGPGPSAPQQRRSKIPPRPRRGDATYRRFRKVGQNSPKTTTLVGRREIRPIGSAGDRLGSSGSSGNPGGSATQDTGSTAARGSDLSPISLSLQEFAGNEDYLARTAGNPPRRLVGRSRGIF